MPLPRQPKSRRPRVFLEGYTEGEYFAAGLSPFAHAWGLLFCYVWCERVQVKPQLSTGWHSVAYGRTGKATRFRGRLAGRSIKRAGARAAPHTTFRRDEPGRQFWGSQK